MDINQALRSSVADLDKINPWIGLTRFSLLGFIFLSLITFAWSRKDLISFIILTAIAGFIYAFWLICTHDMTHQTLTGWRWFDTIFSRLIAWPMFWPYGTYSALHILHHSWNGYDLRDPERVQWTLTEYQKGNLGLRWYINHQILVDMFILGGLGLILKTFKQGFRFRSLRPHLTQQITLDMIGMIVFHGIFSGIALYYGLFWRYLLCWIILERTVGIIVQMRDHLEHYGKWGQQEGHLLTQLYATRNLKVNGLTQWLMGGLPDHSVHHAFPHLPFYQLPQALERIQVILETYHLSPLELGQGYLRETLLLASLTQLIDDQGARGSKNCETLKRDRVL